MGPSFGPKSGCAILRYASRSIKRRPAHFRNPTILTGVYAIPRIHCLWRPAAQLPSQFMNHPVYSAVEADFEAVNQLIISSLSSHVPLVEEISSYLIEAGGKRLRPLLVLLSANACGYNFPG